MKRWVLLVAAAVALGIVNAVIFLGFEWIVNNGSDFIWNDWLQTDTTRWLVVPVAIILSVVFSWALRLMRQPRWITPTTNLDLNTEATHKPTLAKVGSVLTVGASGLIAGASLGPEMPLTESSHALGSWVRSKLRISPELGTTIVAASIGALMVAFLGSLLLIVLSFVIAYKATKRITFSMAVLILLAGVAAYGTLELLDHRGHGYGDIPAFPPADIGDYAGAIIVGLCASVAALVLVRAIKKLGQVTRSMNERWSWYISAACFGAVLGFLYLVGGQTVQFSGLAGMSLLIDQLGSYSTWALFGIAIVKLAVTAWSKASGYRGGLFFPSIFVGVALSLWLSSLFPGLSGLGIMVGAIAAIFMALSIPDQATIGRREYLAAAFTAFLFMAALVPVQLIPLVLTAIVAVGVGNRVLITLKKHKHVDTSI